MARKSEYIADVLTQLNDVRVPPARPIKDEFRQFIDSSGHIARLIEGREIYSFTTRALHAASDLRVDTPERMERLIEAVTRAPGKLFLEAKTVDLMGILSNIRGFVNPKDYEGAIGSDRIGFAVDISEVGKVTFRVMRMIDPVTVEMFLGPARHGQLVKALSKSVLEMAHLRARILAPRVVAELDIRRHVGMSRQEFQQVLERANPGDAFLDEARADLAQLNGVRERAQGEDCWWRMSRLRDLIDISPETRQISVLEQTKDNPALPNPLNIGLHLIALLAVLTAEAREIAFYPRGHDPETISAILARQARPIKKVDTTRPREPGHFRIVSLNIDLPNTESAGATEGGSSGSEVSHRARHPVRGHLFLARNGNLVWRKPHWRGALDQAVIHRVTAKL